MRTIKFRAWHKANKVMVNFDPEILVRDQYQQKGLCDLMNGCDSGYLMQYTGLTDKNGKEIYEGDIYHTGSSSGKRYQIMFVGGAWCGGISEDWCMPLLWTFDMEEAESEDDMFIASDWVKSHIEVIGNIHENPELLTQ